MRGSGIVLFVSLSGCYLSHERPTAREDSGPIDAAVSDAAEVDAGTPTCDLSPIATSGWPMLGARADRTHRAYARAPDAPARVRYDVDLGLEFAVDLVADADGRAFLPIGSDIVALAPDGSVAWRVSFDARPPRAPVVLGDGTLLVTAGETATLLARTDGAIVREVPLPGPTYDPLVFEGDLVVHTQSPAGIARIDCDGSVLFETSAEAGDHPAAPIAMDATGRAYLLVGAPGDTYRCVLLAVEPDGGIAYRTELDGYATGGPAVAPSGAVYVSLGRGVELASHFIVIDRDGTVTMDLDLGEQSNTVPDPIAIDDAGRAFVRTWESVGIVDPITGLGPRRFNHPNLVYAIAIDLGGRVVRTSGVVDVLSADTLEPLAVLDPPAPTFCFGGTALGEGGLFATACDGHAVSLGGSP